MGETILIVLGGIGLLAAGVGLGFWLGQLRVRGEATKVEEVQQQFDDYRQNVTQHFGRTAEHFKAIGREYRELYEHMASGADALCEREAMDAKLSFAPTAILESIAGEREEPDRPRDYAEDQQAAPADGGTGDEREAGGGEAAATDEDAVSDEAKPEAGMETDEEPPRTYH